MVLQCANTANRSPIAEILVGQERTSKYYCIVAGSHQAQGLGCEVQEQWAWWDGAGGRSVEGHEDCIRWTVVISGLAEQLSPLVR